MNCRLRCSCCTTKGDAFHGGCVTGFLIGTVYGVVMAAVVSWLILGVV
jgi:hypothetical protein